MLFAWLQTSIAGSTCLDMFAGSGALGFEAASRGASDVVMLERERTVVSALQQNKDRLLFDNVTIVNADALASSTYKTAPLSGLQFDVIFVDPPFAQNMHLQALETIIESRLLQAQGIVYLETGSRAGDVRIPDNWLLQREKTAGDVRVQMYRAIAEP